MFKYFNDKKDTVTHLMYLKSACQNRNEQFLVYVWF